MDEGGERVWCLRERKRDSDEAEIIGGETEKVWDRVRPAACLVLLHEVNKLPKSKASWSSIILKWEGEVEWRGRGGRRGVECDRGEWVKERRSWERKWTVDVKVEVVNGRDISLTSSSFPTLQGSLLDGRGKEEWRRRRERGWWARERKWIKTSVRY